MANKKYYSKKKIKVLWQKSHELIVFQQVNTFYIPVNKDLLK